MLSIFTYIASLYIVKCQYYTIWEDSFDVIGDWKCGKGATWNQPWTSACYIPNTESYCPGTGNCALVCAVGDGYWSSWWMQRSTNIAIYSALRLEFQLGTYSIETGEECQIWYSYDGGNRAKVFSTVDSVTAYDQSVGLGSSTGFASNIDIYLEVYGNSDKCNDACYFDDVILKGIPRNTAPIPTTRPTAPTPKLTTNPTTQPSKSPLSLHPTPTPTATPRAEPTFIPTPAPTSTPTESPTVSPSQPPTTTPTYSPTAVTQTPSRAPTISPTTAPTHAPTITWSLCQPETECAYISQVIFTVYWDAADGFGSYLADKIWVQMKLEKLVRLELSQYVDLDHILTSTTMRSTIVADVMIGSDDKEVIDKLTNDVQGSDEMQMNIGVPLTEETQQTYTDSGFNVKQITIEIRHIKPSGSNTSDPTETGPKSKTNWVTISIVIFCIGILVFICALFGACFYFKPKKKRVQSLHVWRPAKRVFVGSPRANVSVLPAASLHMVPVFSESELINEESEQKMIEIESVEKDEELIVHASFKKNQVDMEEIGDHSSHESIYDDHHEELEAKGDDEVVEPQKQIQHNDKHKITTTADIYIKYNNTQKQNDHDKDDKFDPHISQVKELGMESSADQIELLKQEHETTKHEDEFLIDNEMNGEEFHQDNVQIAAAFVHDDAVNEAQKIQPLSGETDR